MRDNPVGETTREDERENRHSGACRGDHGGSCVEVMAQAWPEVTDPCYLCGHETRGLFVVWGLSTGELVHVCDECVADDESDDDGPELLREGQPEFNGVFG